MTVHQLTRQSSRKAKAPSKLGEDLWTRTIVVSKACPREMIPDKGRSWKPSDFDITKTLFVGKRSVIYRARCLGCGVDLVLKVYVKNRLAAVHRRQVEREIQIHSSLFHPNIISMYAAFEDENHVYLMVESAPKGDLLDDMNKRDTFYPMQTIQLFVRQILDAINYLHKRGIMHRDMKPENIVLVDNKYSIKLIDFGLAIDFSAERPVSAVGTLQYMAPEVVVCPTKSRPEENKENTMLQYGTGADIWALGILVFELLTGRAPFDTGKKVAEEETEKRIMYMEPEFPATLSKDASDFVKRSIAKVPGRRMCAGELLCHRWLNDGVDVRPPHTATALAGAPTQTAAAPPPQRPSPSHSLQPQLSMYDMQAANKGGMERKGSGLMPERSYMMASAAAKDSPEQQWRFSKDRLQKPVDGALHVTGTPEFEEAVGREEAREYESDKDSAFCRPSTSSKGKPTTPGDSSQLGRWVEPTAPAPRSSAEGGGISLSGSFAQYHQPSPDSPQRGGGWRSPTAGSSSSPVAGTPPGSPATHFKGDRPPSARPRYSHGRPESAASPHQTGQRAVPAGWPASAVSSPARKSPPRGRVSARSSSRAISHTSQAKVEASLRHSLLLAESSAPAFSRVSMTQQAGARRSGGLGKEQSEPVVASPSSIIRQARTGGMSGYESYSAMRAALLSAGGPGGGKPASTARPAGSARKSRVAVHQRPSTSQVARTAAEGASTVAPGFGRSTVVNGAKATSIAAGPGRAPQFARWANTQRPSTQQAAQRAAATSFGASWAAQQASTRNLVSHGTSITLSPRS